MAYGKLLLREVLEENREIAFEQGKFERRKLAVVPDQPLFITAQVSPVFLKQTGVITRRSCHRKAA